MQGSGKTHSPLKRLGLFALMPLVILLAAERFSHYFGLPIDLLLRDPGAVTETPYYVGAVSNIGIVMWCAGACFCLFGSMVLRELATAGMGRWLLLSAGLLTTLLMLDDCFQLHESALPHLFGVPESTLMVLYAVWGVTMTWRYRKIIRSADGEVYLAAVVMLGLSVAVDMLPHDLLGRWIHLIEDGFKLTGICFWTIYFALTTRRLTLESARPLAPKVQRLLGPLRRHTRGSMHRTQRGIRARPPRKTES